MKKKSSLLLSLDFSRRGGGNVMMCLFCRRRETKGKSSKP